MQKTHDFAILYGTYQQETIDSIINGMQTEVELFSYKKEPYDETFTKYIIQVRDDGDVLKLGFLIGKAIASGSLQEKNLRKLIW